MELWFTEEWLPGFKVSVKVKSLVCSKKTKFQDLAIYDTERLGRILVLDNAIQTTEVDEYIYHESMVHVPLLCHPNPERVLIIGGGDGGSLREVVKHPEVKEAVMVDIDGEVVEASKAYLPGWNRGFKDPRANVIIGNGPEYVANAKSEFDVVIVDSTDPVGPGEVLFTEEFYSSIRRALKPHGLMAAQTESPFIMPEILKEIYGRLARVYPVAKLYTAPVPTYPGGWWSFICASLGPDPAVPKRSPEDSWGLKFYSPEIHSRLFVLSPGVKAGLKGD